MSGYYGYGYAHPYYYYPSYVGQELAPGGPSKLHTGLARLLLEHRYPGQALEQLPMPTALELGDFAFELMLQAYGSALPVDQVLARIRSNAATAEEMARRSAARAAEATRQLRATRR